MELGSLRRGRPLAAAGTLSGSQSGCGKKTGKENWNLGPAVAARVKVIAGARLVVPASK